MSVVLILHADEGDCFLTFRLCSLRLKVNQKHHCNNWSVSLKIEHWNKSWKRCKGIKDKKCDLRR